VRNVLAAGGCVVRWKGADHRTERPELVGHAEARAYYSRFGWAVTQRVFGPSPFCGCTGRPAWPPRLNGERLFVPRMLPLWPLRTGVWPGDTPNRTVVPQ
jgi:hypothetical protein